MKIPIFQIDAFASALFSGNPAAVCPLERWLPDALLQKIAAENNLAETAYFVPETGGGYHLRWFTPEVEVDLCGHATLAAAWVIMNELTETNSVRFTSRGGELTVDRKDDSYTLNFPSRMPEALPANPQLEDALGASILELWGSRDYMAVLESEDAVRALEPNMEKLKKLDGFAVIVTAASEEFDFVSRFFAPSIGVNEDSVTGSAHCILAPFWGARLRKNPVRGFQASKRGGEVHCQVEGDRVLLSGTAAKYLEGFITLE